MKRPPAHRSTSPAADRGGHIRRASGTAPSTTTALDPCLELSLTLGLGVGLLDHDVVEFPEFPDVDDLAPEHGRR